MMPVEKARTLMLKKFNSTALEKDNPARPSQIP
jgi:hypothetical protein